MSTNDGSIDRLTWLANVLQVIAQFASAEFQQAAWVEFQGPDGATFEEACELLDDFRLEDAISSASNLYRLQPDERHALLEFWRALEDYLRNVYEVRVRTPGETYASPKKIVGQPEWAEVQVAALTTLKVFKARQFSKMPRLPIFDRQLVGALKRFWEV